MKAFAGARRGRPRKMPQGGERADDRGTVELQRKRAALARGADPAAVAHPLDLLLERGTIDEAAHRAGFIYAGLYRRIAGRTDVSCRRLYEGLGSGSGSAGRVAANDDDPPFPEARFRRAQRALGALGHAAFRATERVAVFAEWPGWLISGDRSVEARDGALEIRRGLAALAQALRERCPELHRGRDAGVA